jgi:hypothetical protein
VVALRREWGAHGERDGDGTRGGMLVPLVVEAGRRAGGGVTDPGTQVVECLQNVGVAPEQAGNQNPQDQDHECQEEYESKHDASFDSEERRRLYRGAREIPCLFDDTATRDAANRTITQRSFRLPSLRPAIR